MEKRAMQKEEELGPGARRVAWYFALEDARRRRDWRGEAEARRELQRLGVVVVFLEEVGQ